MSGPVNTNTLSQSDKEQLAKLGLQVDSNGVVSELNNNASVDTTTIANNIPTNQGKQYAFTLGDVVSGEIQGVVIKPNRLVNGANQFTLYEEDYSLLGLAKQIVSHYSKNGVAIFIPEAINRMVSESTCNLDKIKEVMYAGAK